MKRSRRLIEIRKIIQDSKIANQQELLDILNQKGINYTQATLSRDLKYLKVGKIQDPEKGMIYILSGGEQSGNLSSGAFKQKEILENGFISIEYTGNMAVIKTMPGFASGLAYKLDMINAFEIIGTIAGDDTILVIGREGVSRTDLIKSLKPLIP